jgi:hypothetical protein
MSLSACKTHRVEVARRREGKPVVPKAGFRRGAEGDMLEVCSDGDARCDARSVHAKWFR